MQCTTLEVSVEVSYLGLGKCQQQGAEGDHRNGVLY